MAMLTYNHSLYDMQHVNYHYDHYNTRIMIYHSETKNPTKYRLDNAFKRSQKSNQTSINFRKKGYTTVQEKSKKITLFCTSNIPTNNKNMNKCVIDG